MVALLILALPVQAASTSGFLMGVFEGNDSVESLFADLGLVVTHLARVNTPPSIDSDSLTTDGLTINNFMLNAENEALSGLWSYDGPAIANIIVLKADGFYAVYSFSDTLNTGKWDVGDITDFAGHEFTLSHITAYNLVPIPAAVWLFASGLLGLGFARRKSGLN